MAKAAPRRSAPLLDEVQRAANEIRSALGSLARQERLPPMLLSLCTLMDRAEIGVLEEPGDSAFALNEGASLISFRQSVLQRTIDEAYRLADLIGLDEEDEARRIQQLAVNLLVLHELMHIQQNFPSFGMVQKIKLGMPVLGLPMLDVAADTVAAWVSARVECERLGEPEETQFLAAYVNCLMLAYLVGAFVFTVVGRPEKMQRALGLLVSAALVQAKVTGRLNENMIYENWDPMSPIMAFDLDTAGAFNAFVIDRVPGLLVANADKVSNELLAQIWKGIGTASPVETLELIARALIAVGVIRKSAND